MGTSPVGARHHEHLRHQRFEGARSSLLRDRQVDFNELPRHRLVHALLLRRRLESGNVCEYFIVQQYFHELGVTAHDEVLYEMGMKEKEHEQFFLDAIATRRLLPVFQRVFSWGIRASYNDVDLAAPHHPSMSSAYCKRSIAEAASPRARPSRRLRTIQS